MADAVETSAEAPSPETSRRKAVKKEKRAKGVVPENVLYSTKVNALIGDLMQTSKVNPYSANFDPMSVGVQLIDGDENKGVHLTDGDWNNPEDGVVKTIVL